MLIKWPDWSATGPLPLKKKRILERSLIQDQVDTMCQLYGIKKAGY